ncbi:hypothetical protein KKA14_00350 [bacterium]|nr:hypothetical protein [bacterium]
MASTRIKKIGGNYSNKEFFKVLKQLNGRALLLVVVINRNCEECAILQKFISQLEAGFIDKLPQLVIFYGYNETPLDAKPDTKEKKDGEGEKKGLLDSRLLYWKEVPEGHGYGLFLDEKDIQYYKGTFDHEGFAASIIDNLRRFRSSIKTLAGLSAKRSFLQKMRTGIIIETNSATQQSQIMELEKKVQALGTRLTIPVFFCKGINQEISLIVKGEVSFKLRGHNFEKFLRKIPK